MLIKGKSILFPVKITETKYVASYSAKLVNGEEQLIITRDCRLYLTDGKGGYIEFKSINSGVTLLEVQKLIDKLDEKLTNEINDTNNDLDTLTSTINQLIADINLKFENYVTAEQLNEVAEDAKHTNRNTLDKLSQDAVGNLLYDGKKIASGKISLKTLPTFGGNNNAGNS